MNAYGEAAMIHAALEREAGRVNHIVSAAKALKMNTCTGRSVLGSQLCHLFGRQI